MKLPIAVINTVMIVCYSDMFAQHFDALDSELYDTIVWGALQCSPSWRETWRKPFSSWSASKRK